MKSIVGEASLTAVLRSTEGDDEGTAASTPIQSEAEGEVQERKRARRSSSSSDATERLIAAFTQAVAPPPPPASPSMPLPRTVTEFFQQLALSDEQIASIRALLPAAAGDNPSFHLLLGVDHDNMTACGLSPVQTRAWIGLVSRIIASAQ